MIKLTRKSFGSWRFSIWSSNQCESLFRCYFIPFIQSFVLSAGSVLLLFAVDCSMFIYGSVWFCRIAICRHNVWSCLSGANMLKIITFIFITFLSNVCIPLARSLSVCSSFCMDLFVVDLLLYSCVHFNWEYFVNKRYIAAAIAMCSVHHMVCAAKLLWMNEWMAIIFSPFLLICRSVGWGLTLVPVILFWWCRKNKNKIANHVFLLCIIKHTKTMRYRTSPGKPFSCAF